jgi:DNA polymerase III epsilon subunit-like protein
VPTDPSPTDASATSGAHDGRSGTRFVFIDTEATGLDHARHEVTEVAWIVRFEDGREEERRYFPQHTIDGADDDALELTHYEERIAPQEKTPAKVWLTEFLEHADGAVLVGAVPDFDARHLDLACRKLGVEPTWDHHLLDVETLALPFIAPGPETPRSLAKTCAALGVPHDKDQAHGALYDAQQAKAVFDRVWQLVADLRASGDPLPPAVPRDPRNGRNGGNNGNSGEVTADAEGASAEAAAGSEAAAGGTEVSTTDATARAVEAVGATDTGQPPHAPG